MIGTYLIIYLTKYVYENEACIENEALLRIITSLQEQIALDEYLFKLSSSKKDNSFISHYFYPYEKK